MTTAAGPRALPPAAAPPDGAPPRSARGAGALRAAAGIAFAAAFAFLLLRGVSPAGLAGEFRGAAPGWLAAAAAVHLAAVWLRGVRWRVLLGWPARPGSAEAAAVFAAGLAANSVTPMRAGELLRAHLLHRRHGHGRIAAIASIAVERILDGAALAIALALALAAAGRASGVAFAAAAACAAGGAVLFALALRPERAAAPLRRLPEPIGRRGREWLSAFALGLRAARGARGWTQAAALTAASWSAEAAAGWCCGQAFGLGLPPHAWLAACAAANLASALPLSPAGAGPYEYAAARAATLFGAQPAAALAWAIALHVLLTVPVSIAGLAAFLALRRAPATPRSGRRTPRSPRSAAAPAAAAGASPGATTRSPRGRPS